MRHIIYNILFVCCAIAFFACEADKEGMNGVGYLRLGVAGSNDVITKAEETYDAEVFTVTITNKTSGEVAKTIEAWAKGEKQEIALEPGTYTISATSAGYDSKAAFDKPYYAGEDEIEITAGNSVERTLTCTLANVRVSVVFDEALLAKYADRTITVSVDGGAGNSLNFGRDEAGRDKQAYFPVADLTAKISISKPQGAGDATPYEYSYTIDDVKAKHWYVLTYRLPDTGDGDFTITYDPTMTTYEYDFVVNPVAKNTASLTANAWAKFAYLTAADVVSDGSTDISALKFQYKKKADSQWTDAETQKESVAVEAGGEPQEVYTAKITGLTDNTAYEYRLANADETFVSTGSFTTEAATELYNGSFELWTTGGNGEKEKETIYPGSSGEAGNTTSFWNTSNPGTSQGMAASVIAGGPANPTTSVTSPVKAGTYAAKLMSTNKLSVFAAASLYTGKFNGLDGMSANMEFGQSFTSRPIALHGYYQYTPQVINHVSRKPEGVTIEEGKTMDQCAIFIALATKSFQFNNKKEEEYIDYANDPAIIAYGELPSGDAAKAEDNNGYVEFNIPLKYKSLTEKPTHIIIVCSASKYGDYMTGADNSTLYVDDFSLVYDGEPKVKE